MRMYCAKQRASPPVDLLVDDVAVREVNILEARLSRKLLKVNTRLPFLSVGGRPREAISRGQRNIRSGLANCFCSIVVVENRDQLGSALPRRAGSHDAPGSRQGADREP